MPIEDILSGDTFARDPGLTWKYLLEIERACRGASANRAHEIIALLENFFEVIVVTQNIDGFHQQAGSSRVIELHGSLRDVYCTSCGDRRECTEFGFVELPPRCDRCRGVLRPNVVLFGEMLPADALASYECEFTKGFDALFAIGTTAGFPYIYGPIVEGARAGVVTVEINPDATDLSKVVKHRIHNGAVGALEVLWLALTNSS